MHLRPYVPLVGFVFLYATPPVTVTSSFSLSTLLIRVQTIIHCYIYTCIATHDIYTHTIYGDGLLPLSICKQKKRGNVFLFRASFSCITVSLVSGGFVEHNVANLISV